MKKFLFIAVSVLSVQFLMYSSDAPMAGEVYSIESTARDLSDSLGLCMHLAAIMPVDKYERKRTFVHVLRAIEKKLSSNPLVDASVKEFLDMLLLWMLNAELLPGANRLAHIAVLRDKALSELYDETTFFQSHSGVITRDAFEAQIIKHFEKVTAETVDDLMGRIPPHEVPQVYSELNELLINIIGSDVGSLATGSSDSCYNLYANLLLVAHAQGCFNGEVFDRRMVMHTIDSAYVLYTSPGSMLRIYHTEPTQLPSTLISSHLFFFSSGHTGIFNGVVDHISLEEIIEQLGLVSDSDESKLAFITWFITHVGRKQRLQLEANLDTFADNLFSSFRAF
jgi:hypothetical protein